MVQVIDFVKINGCQLLISNINEKVRGKKKNYKIKIEIKKKLYFLDYVKKSGLVEKLGKKNFFWAKHEGKNNQINNKIIQKIKKK